MQINWKAIAALTISSLLAGPGLAEKAEVSTVPPTIASKVWPSRVPKSQGPTVQRTVRPHVPKVISRKKMLHKRMIAKQALKSSELQELADSGDGLAAYFYARKLEDSGKPGSLSAAVHYYAMASYLGREFALNRMIALMKSTEITLTKAQVKNGKDALVKLAKSGSAPAALGLADMYAIGHPFAQDPVESRKWMMQAAQAGNANAAQKLATSAMMPQDGSPPDLAAARAALELMLASNEPGKVAMAQALLARLDAANPVEVSQ